MSFNKNTFSQTFREGLLLILPFGATLGIIYWFWITINKFIPDITLFLPVQWLDFPHITLLSDIAILLVIIIFIIFIGMIGSTVFGHFLKFIIEKILAAPTLIRPIYTTFKKITESLFPKEGEKSSDIQLNLSQSVIIPYPNKDSQAIAFITSQNAVQLLGEEEGKKWTVVYCPSAPIISSGFALLINKDEVKECRLNGSDAITTVISVGTSMHSNRPPKELTQTSNSNQLKIWFINGLLFLTPLLGTIFILNWIFEYLFKFFIGFSSLMPEFLYDIIPSNYFDIIISGCLIVVLFFIIIITGLIGESAVGLWIKTFTNKIFNIIPMYNTIYDIIEQITQMFSSDPSKAKSFDQAVLIPFPSESSYAIGFVTGKNSSSIKKQDGDDYIPVFIPTTPIPTTGWFTMTHKSQIKTLDISVDKAFVFVISGGILADK